ncbi:N-acetylmuramoyl-L-alanine amidase [Streptantibioticus rubrisoli]|uniref:N-acetylmuramoyl-L-alanine amidase n=1 Tax=Streptantibioticus rubrisoli TaxID=1387313 RepID=UPI003558C735
MSGRRSRRWASAIAICTALPLSGLVCLPPQATAQPSSGATATGRQRDFAAAAAEFHVPLPVLLGVSYRESLWEGHAGQYSTMGGYGPMNLTDVTASMMASGQSGAAGRGDLATLADDPALHTLTAAAELTKAPAAQLRTDDRQNIRGGAALLASYEKALTGATPADPAQWYGAVARYLHSPDTNASKRFADDVYATLRTGAQRTTADGQQMRLRATSGQPATGQLARLHLRASATPPTDCPAELDCQFIPAATTNYQPANRTSDGLRVQYIVIHDTETTYQQAIDAFQNPANGAAANYVMRAFDGAVTQMVPTKDLAFHAGNYWFNMHSVGIEHEGFAAHGATWYTPEQYQATADLVRYLAAKYDIPLDRQHIIGHDNVPGPVDGHVAGMHWDPGPYWDWAYFMRLVGSPVDWGPRGVGPVGSVVTITPSFDHNIQTVTVCPADDGSGATTTCTDQTQASNFLYVHTQPSADSPLVTDPYLHPTTGSIGTTEIDDWGDTVSTGQQFVVAGRRGAWTAIWFSGRKAWFYNPNGRNTTRACDVTVITPAGAASTVGVYGEGYPQPSEYPPGLNPSTEKPLSSYPLPAGQAYVATAPPANADDFFAKNPPDTVVTGSEQFYTIQYNHRVALVNAADVTADDPWFPRHQHAGG